MHTELTSEPQTDWQDKANCLGVDPDLFFPERGASTREAKEVCRGCVVRTDCLEYALVNGEKFGIWGGLSEARASSVTSSALAGCSSHRLTLLGNWYKHSVSMQTMFAAGFGPPEIGLILVIVLVLFGGSQLPKLAKNLGKAQKEFKEGLAAGQGEASKPAADATKTSEDA